MTADNRTGLLRVIAAYDCHDSIWWNSTLDFYVNCNDAFCWACADAEPINDEDVGELTTALIDAGDDGPLLYVARRRKMRPQGAMYDHIDLKNWPLFDACGPVREAGLGNPKAHP